MFAHSQFAQTFLNFYLDLNFSLGCSIPHALIYNFYDLRKLTLRKHEFKASALTSLCKRLFTIKCTKYNTQSLMPKHPCANYVVRSVLDANQ